MKRFLAIGILCLGLATAHAGDEGPKSYSFIYRVSLIVSPGDRWARPNQPLQTYAPALVLMQCQAWDSARWTGDNSTSYHCDTVGRVDRLNEVQYWDRLKFALASQGAGTSFDRIRQAIEARLNSRSVSEDLVGSKYLHFDRSNATKLTDFDDPETFAAAVLPFGAEAAIVKSGRALHEAVCSQGWSFKYSTAGRIKFIHIPQGRVTLKTHVVVRDFEQGDHKPYYQGTSEMQDQIHAATVKSGEDVAKEACRILRERALQDCKDYATNLYRTHSYWERNNVGVYAAYYYGKPKSCRQVTGGSCTSTTNVDGLSWQAESPVACD